MIIIIIIIIIITTVIIIILFYRKHVWAYLHGFLSGPESFKGRYFQQYLEKLGVDLHLVDLNGPQGYSGES